VKHRILPLFAVWLIVAAPTVMAASAPLASPEADGTAASALSWEVVSRRPHDPEAFTQGLQLDGTGRLFESTGLYGRSTVREVDPVTATVIRSASLPDDIFGEGLALVGGRLIQLTWREGEAALWDRDTFEPLGSFDYDGEGWGLCFDGERLVMSDGSESLTFRDPETFEITGSVQVSHAGGQVLQLNELECVDDQVWANAWLTDTIVRIDPASGRVTGTLDLASLREEVLLAAAPTADVVEPPDVLNGITWDAASETFLVTGKLWPTLFEIRVGDPG
jgi:glutaminyl-peptide cyclotransferase